MLSGGGLYPRTSLCGSPWSDKLKEPLTQEYLNRITQLVDMCEGGLADTSPDFLMILKLSHISGVMCLAATRYEPPGSVGYPTYSNVSRGETYS